MNWFNRVIVTSVMVAALAVLSVSFARANSVDDIKEGLAAASRGDYVQAVALYTRALGSEKLSATNQETAYLDRCSAYVEMGADDRAVDDCNAALHRNADDADVYINRCSAYNGKGEYDLAISDCNNAIRLMPSSAYAYNDRCNAEVMEGKDMAAVADCNTAIRLGTYDGMAGNRSCLVAMRLGVGEAAVADCAGMAHKRAIEFVAYTNRGKAEFGLGQFDAAARDFGRGDVDFIGSLRREIWLYLSWGRSGRMDLATADLQQAQLDPDTWDGALANFLLGKTSADRLHELVSRLSGGAQSRAICDAQFVIAEQGLIAHQMPAVRNSLNELATRCVLVRPLEHATAIAELQRLSSPQKQTSATGH